MKFSTNCLVFSTVLLTAQSSSAFTGKGTTYDVGSPSSGNCNFMSWPSFAKTNFAALNDKQWNSTMNCGTCATVRCTDPSCAGQPSEIVYILDRCPECGYGDLDLSPSVFKSITGQAPSKLAIEWEFVACPIQGNVQYCAKSGSSNFWLAVQPTNFVSGVQSLTINGKGTTMVDSAFYFLVDGKGGQVAKINAVNISLTGVNGEVLQDMVALTADACTEGNSQFSGGTTIAPTTATPVTDAPTTATPVSNAPTTATPVTNAPTTATPVTNAPTTATPVTNAPTTATPVTNAPTNAPTTATPVTNAPTTATPVTNAPTTATPVTNAPTTATPVTNAPTTATPVTNAPTTATPVTNAPTTATPITTTVAETLYTAPTATILTPAKTTRAPGTKSSSRKHAKPCSKKPILRKNSLGDTKAPTSTTTNLSTNLAAMSSTKSSPKPHSTRGFVASLAVCGIVVAAVLAIYVRSQNKKTTLKNGDVGTPTPTEIISPTPADALTAFESVRSPRAYFVRMVSLEARV